MPMYQSRKRLPASFSSCMVCTMRTECIRCSALSQVDPKHPEKLRDLVTREIYRDMEPTPAMLAGTADHKELEERRKVDTDPESVIKRIRNKETFYFSLTFCVPPSETVFCNPEPKPIQDVKVGERVLTHRGLFMPVTDTFMRDYDGDLINIEARGGIKLAVTSEHPILVARVASPRSYPWRSRSHGYVPKAIESSWIEAKKVQGGDMLVIPIPKEQREPEPITLSKTREVLHRIRGSVGHHHNKRVKRVLTLTIKPDRNLLRLSGFYLSEGYATRYRDKKYNFTHHRLSFTFSKNEGDWAAEVKEMLNSIFRAKSVVREHGSVIVVQSGDQFATNFFLNHFGNKSSKTLPDWVMFASPELQSELVKSFWQGDGSRLVSPDHLRYSMTQTNEPLMKQIWVILARLGVISMVAHPKPRPSQIDGRRITATRPTTVLITEGSESVKFAAIVGDKYQFVFRHRAHASGAAIVDGNVFVKVKRVTKTSYTGPVYNLSVKDAESFTVGGAAVHNCSVRYGLRGTVDAVLCDWQGDTLRFLIIDDKTHIEGRYFKQIWAYGMIMSDPSCLYTRALGGEGEEIDRKPFYPAIGECFDNLEIWTTLNPYKYNGRVVDRPLPAKPFSRARIFVDKGLVFAVLRSKKKIINAFSEPAILAATQQMKFKRSGNQLVLYEPKK